MRYCTDVTSGVGDQQISLTQQAEFDRRPLVIENPIEGRRSACTIGENLVLIDCAFFIQQWKNALNIRGVDGLLASNDSTSVSRFVVGEAVGKCGLVLGNTRQKRKIVGCH